MLNRSLSLWQLVLIGMVIVQPTAPMGIYGVISNTAHGHVVTAILIAMAAMLFTAVSYGRMARLYPSAGSAYVYVRQEIHPALGFVVGWALLLDYLLNPLVCTAFCAKAMTNIVPGVPYYAWVPAFVGLFTLLNLRGVQTSARLSGAMCGVLLLVVVVFLAFVWHRVAGAGHDAAFFWRPFHDPASFRPDRVLAGASVAVLTYIGFDAVSTLSEEARDPRRAVMRAIMLVCLTTGLLSGLEVYAAQLVWGSAPFPAGNVESAFAMVAGRLGGVALFQMINVALLVATVGSGLGSQLAAGRLLYSMGRAGALPRRFFGTLDPVHRIPRNNILAVGAVTVAGAEMMEAFAGRLGGDAFEIGAQALNFGAFVAFMGVNAAAFAAYAIRQRRRSPGFVLTPLAGFAICAFVWAHLNRTALIVGGSWLAWGVVYGGWRTLAARGRTGLGDMAVPEAE
ncbi:APC family permease [Gluconacetobacter tumulisoli]|uniref:APC family permease n=2 Tax=Gluconacetobacter tumulisoli TaxID=1286189 RepID=A0A7W4K5N5_9PROT|nr:APC family permease [Gluconacetobacter tumulisoli]